MKTYQGKRNFVLILIGVWFILFALQGAGVLGASIQPHILGLPFSVAYLTFMGIWGVANTCIAVKLLSPYFFQKVDELARED